VSMSPGFRRNRKKRDRKGAEASVNRERKKKRRDGPVKGERVDHTKSSCWGVFSQGADVKLASIGVEGVRFLESLIFGRRSDGHAGDRSKGGGLIDVVKCQRAAREKAPTEKTPLCLAPNRSEEKKKPKKKEKKFFPSTKKSSLESSSCLKKKNSKRTKGRNPGKPPLSENKLVRSFLGNKHYPRKRVFHRRGEIPGRICPILQIGKKRCQIWQGHQKELTLQTTSLVKKPLRKEKNSQKNYLRQPLF